MSAPARVPAIAVAVSRPEGHVWATDTSPEAIYAPGDWLGPLERMLDLCAVGKLRMPGWVLVQYRRRVLEADCRHLLELRARLETQVRLAA